MNDLVYERKIYALVLIWKNLNLRGMASSPCQEAERRNVRGLPFRFFCARGCAICLYGEVSDSLTKRLFFQ